MTSGIFSRCVKSLCNRQTEWEDQHNLQPEMAMMEAVCHINRKFVYTVFQTFCAFSSLFMYILVLAPNKIIMFIYRYLCLSDSSSCSKQEITFWLKCRGDETTSKQVCVILSCQVYHVYMYCRVVVTVYTYILLYTGIQKFTVFATVTKSVLGVACRVCAVMY